MVAVSSRRSIRDPEGDSKATLCHLGNEIAFGFNRGENGKCETAMLPFFFASPRHFGLVLDCETETSRDFECDRETFRLLKWEPQI